MKVLITGTRELSLALSYSMSAESVACVSKSTGHDINRVADWGYQFKDFDMVVNCAYDGLGQLSVLEYFFNMWKHDSTKTIVTIGSRVISYPRTEPGNEYWPYKVHKQALVSAFESMLPEAKCDLKLINPGPIDTAMIEHLDVPKISASVLADRIYRISQDKQIKRIDLWI